MTTFDFVLLSHVFGPTGSQNLAVNLHQIAAISPRTLQGDRLLRGSTVYLAMGAGTLDVHESPAHIITMMGAIVAGKDPDEAVREAQRKADQR